MKNNPLQKTDVNTFELIPQKGISELSFGMSRKEVRAILKNSYGIESSTDTKSPKDFYYDNSLQFNYQNNTLSFIEIALGHPLPFQLKLFDAFIHKMGGKKLQELIESRDMIDDRLSLEDNLYFKDNYITLWRSHRKAKWDALGMGDERFYKASLASLEDLDD